MGSILNDYLPILIFMSLSAFVVMALTLPPILFAPKHPDKESIDNLVKCVEIRSEHKEIIGN